MRPEELSKARRILERTVLELNCSYEREAISVDRTADDLDSAILAAERELAAQSIEQRLTRMREIHEALERMDQGRFGVCSNCEETISAVRLQAVPWAAYCLRCQEAEERTRSSVRHTQFAMAA